MKTWRRNTGAIRLMSAKQHCQLPTGGHATAAKCDAGIRLGPWLGCVSKCDCDDRAVTGQYGERIYSLLSFHITPKACRIRVSCVVR